MHRTINITLVLLAVVSIGAVGMTLNYIASAQEPTTVDCPAGSYDAGGFCKAEPTGCPYAENIPVDSPKCRAAADRVLKAEQMQATADRVEAERQQKAAPQPSPEPDTFDYSVAGK